MGVGRQILGLLGWVGLATYLYFSTLTLKPMWTDEFATIVFSLGHSFKGIPINQLISLPALLTPLQITPTSSWSIVLQRLLTEDTHPPVFFWLNYEWLQAGAKWWPQWFLVCDNLRSVADHRWPSVFAVRSLPAVFGVLCVPAMFAFGWVSTRNWRVAQLAAGLMAVSPFSLFLAQEARHYSLAALWVIFSLTCWMAMIQAWQQRSIPSLWLSWVWILVNALGIATHYFFVLILCVEAMVLLLLLPSEFPGFNRQKNTARGWRFWFAIGTAAIGTGLNGLMWLSIWRSFDHRELIQWVYTGAETGWQAWVNPIVNLLVGGITMVTLWPIQGVPQGWAIVGGGLTLLSAIGIAIAVSRGLRQQWQQRVDDRLPMWAAIAALTGAMVSLLYLDYGGGADVTRGFRFNFLYLPSLLLLVAWGLAGHRCWARWSGAVIFLGLLGSLSVGHNLAYQKVHQPAAIVDAIVQLEQAVLPTAMATTKPPAVPLVIMTPFRTHAQTTRLMSLAWELQRRDRSAQFYFDQQYCPRDNPAACKQLTPLAKQTMQTKMRQPYRLWLINYSPLEDLPAIGCQFDRAIGRRSVDGFTAQPYRCEPPPLVN
jgi:uncharacterized membrane protein